MSADEAKIIGQFRLEIGSVMSAFDCYGLGTYIPEAMAAIEALALQMHRRLNGEDMPYQVEFDRRR